jgi:hypothetical protein
MLEHYGDAWNGTPNVDGTSNKKQEKGDRSKGKKAHGIALWGHKNINKQHKGWPNKGWSDGS